MATVASLSRHPVAGPRSGTSSRLNAQAAIGDQPRTPTKILPPPRSAVSRLKVVIRRLPPGLTEEEFKSLLGAEWRTGGEKVDWYNFKVGKITKDISKSSVPARAYLNLTKPEYLNQLSSAVKETNFADARNTAGDSCLLGPPVVEMSTYGRIPSSKPRKDARQGTIDQDSEFMNFLQGLTNPITKPTPIDANTFDRDGKSSGDVVTPLIQFLRDKKANKEKSKDQPKSAKQGRQDAKDPKAAPGEKGTATAGSKSKSNKEAMSSTAFDKKSSSTPKPDKTTREVVKVLSKHSANVQKSAQVSSTATSKPQTSGSDSINSPAPPERKQRKVGAEAKSLLQRDLGLGTGAVRRRRGEAAASSSGGVISSTSNSRRDSTAGQTSHSAAAATAETSVTKGSGQAKAAQASQMTTTPATQKDSGSVAKAGLMNAGTTQSNATLGGVSSTGAYTGTQAFLKHVNASQGINEGALQTALSTFGPVKKIEIDKKKGFAYVDFTDTESLRKAIASSPVKVGQGNVSVLERKEKSAKQDRGGRTGGAGSTPSTSTQTAGTGNSADKAGSTSAPTSGSNSGQTSLANSHRSGGNRGHRSRGNRARGSGRAGGEKGTNSQPANNPAGGAEVKNRDN